MNVRELREALADLPDLLDVYVTGNGSDRLADHVTVRQNCRLSDDATPRVVIR